MITRNQIALGNYSHSLYDFDSFLDCIEKLEIQNIELWAAGPHFYIDDYDAGRTKAFAKKIFDRQLNVICLTPEQCLYPINIASEDDIARKRSIAYFMRSVEMCEQLQTKMLLITPGQGYRNKNRNPLDAQARCVESVQMIAAEAAKSGITIAMEHLTKKTTDFAVYAKELATLVQMIGMPNVIGMVDTDMAGRVNENINDYFQALNGKVSHVHFVDGMPGGHLVPGEGVLNLEQQFRDLAAYDYKGYITPEVMNERYAFDPDDALERTVSWFDQQIARL